MAIRTLSTTITGISAYSQSKAHDTPFMEKESHEDFDKRTWRNKAHLDKDGTILIPGMSIKWSVAEAARRLQIKIAGKRGQTYSKLMLSGLLVTGNLRTGIHIDDAMEDIIYANADGVRGSGKRVFRRFPTIAAGWTADLELQVIDDELPKDVVERCLVEAGNLIGIGRFRPEKGGFLGRFTVGKVTWTQETPRRLAA